MLEKAHSLRRGTAEWRWLYYIWSGWGQATELWIQSEGGSFKLGQAMGRGPHSQCSSSTSSIMRMETLVAREGPQGTEACSGVLTAVSKDLVWGHLHSSE